MMPTHPRGPRPLSTAPDAVNRRKESTVLLVVVLVLLILWALGFFVASVGTIIHALLVVALVVLIYQLVTGRRAV